MSVNDGYTVALLHMNGTDTSTTFTDETGKSWTASGNAQIDTAQSVFGGASGLFDGTGDFISSADHADWQLDGGSNSNFWTVDFRIRYNGDPVTQGMIQQRVDNNNQWAIFLISGTSIRMYIQSGGTNLVILDFAWNPATTTWYHVAIVKNGTSGYMAFVDGSQVGTTQTDTDPMPDFAGSLVLGDWVDTAGSHNYLNGWLDEVRISKGIARWTANFTPPSIEYGNEGSINAGWYM
jgi:hypothetical protein